MQAPCSCAGPTLPVTKAATSEHVQEDLQFVAWVQVAPTQSTTVAGATGALAYEHSSSFRFGNLRPHAYLGVWII